MRTRIVVHVEKYSDDDPATHDVWFVNADKLVHALQASPAFIEGLSCSVIVSTG